MPPRTKWHGLLVSNRLRHCLELHNITSIEEARALGRTGLLRLPHMGRKSRDELWDALEAYRPSCACPTCGGTGRVQPAAAA
ncbi:MAG: DNA-directed RNA polymerase subunit alpha C-terminal domain-containing protein [Janthinobacterium lividum]